MSERSGQARALEVWECVCRGAAVQARYPQVFALQAAAPTPVLIAGAHGFSPAEWGSCFYFIYSLIYVFTPAAFSPFHTSSGLQVSVPTRTLCSPGLC